MHTSVLRARLEDRSPQPKAGQIIQCISPGEEITPQDKEHFW